MLRPGLPHRWLREVPGARAVGSILTLSALESCGQVDEQGGDTPIRTRTNPRPSWGKSSTAGTSKEGICKSVWGRTFPHGPTQCGYLLGLSATGQGQPHAAWRHLVPTRRLGWL